jgi:glucose-1-phosphate cytidylyltransferase
MKAIILAGGLGTRISEETATRPKPMIEIGGKPILWHILKIYAHHGITDFIICLGYRGYMIKEYFSNYFLHTSDVTIDLAKNQIDVHHRSAEPWRVTLVDTGEATQTGGRLKRVLPYVADEPVVAFTYGDGVADIDVTSQLAFHRAHGKTATVAAVRPMRRFGALELDGDRVKSFREKPDGEGGWVNGGFFLLSTGVGTLLKGDACIWEQEPLEHLARTDELKAYFHSGFWHPVDTLRDKNYLEQEWATGKAAWKVW